MARLAHSTCVGALALMLTLTALIPCSEPLSAQEDGAQLKVVGIAANDVLNVREYPTTESRIIGMIPPDGRGIVYLSEKSGPWIFVRYGQFVGWVHARYVMSEFDGYVRRGRRLD